MEKPYLPGDHNNIITKIQETRRIGVAIGIYALSRRTNGG